MTKEGKPLSAAEKILAWQEDHAFEDPLEVEEERKKRAQEATEISERKKLLLDVDEKFGITAALEEINERALEKRGNVSIGFNYRNDNRPKSMEVRLDWDIVDDGSGHFSGHSICIEVFGPCVRISAGVYEGPSFPDSKPYTGKYVLDYPGGYSGYEMFRFSDPNFKKKFDAELFKSFKHSFWRFTCQHDYGTNV